MRRLSRDPRSYSTPLVDGLLLNGDAAFERSLPAPAANSSVHSRVSCRIIGVAAPYRNPTIKFTKSTSRDRIVLWLVLWLRVSYIVERSMGRQLFSYQIWFGVAGPGPVRFR